MPYTGELESLRSEGIVQSFLAAGNLPLNVTVGELTQLFDAAGIVSNIKILDTTESQSDGPLVRTAIIGYYSDENVRVALKELHENMALGLDRPMKLEYFGPVAMKDVETELIKRINLAAMINGVHLGH